MRNQERTTDRPIGRVHLLEDTDGDGKLDRSVVFAEGLSWATGIALYDGGAYVCGTPDIWYFKDTDGDGKADIRRKAFTGFRKLNVQAVINNLAWGLDGKIYGAGSSNGGEIRTLRYPDAPPVTLGRNDFCFDPRDEKFQVISGGARFGNSFDDWGNRFVCNIRNPAQHILLPARIWPAIRICLSPRRSTTWPKRGTTSRFIGSARPSPGGRSVPNAGPGIAA